MYTLHSLKGILSCLAGLGAGVVLAAGTLPPTAVPGLSPVVEYFPGTAYRATVPTQQSLLGFAPGARASSAAEIEKCLRAWAAAAPDRTRLVEYARTYEQRPLHYMVVTAPKNLARLDEIQSSLARLGDPRRVSEGEAAELIRTLPAVAWLAYTIHGDETEGSDAALALLYHLIAAEDASVAGLLEGVVVIVDPLMNPDGRDRFVKMIAEHRGAMPSVDDQSLIHDGYWPYGRGNHYLFDLNRDWIWGVHPETRGRIREVAKWNPQLLVDAHGMGSQETHLFSPPREPINPNIPASREEWGRIFARDQSQALDRHPLLYYTGEWHEEWYPGYSDGWSSYRGAVGILYEQARIAEDGVRRPEGRVLSYGEAVAHHVWGNLANLKTLIANREALLKQFHANRQAAVAPEGPYARRTFAFLPTANASRRRALIDLLRLEGFELFQLPRDYTATRATDQLGRELRDARLPAGTVLVPNRQPLAHLLAAMLEFDPRLPTRTLETERQELLRKGRSRIYDTTAWNVSMMFDLAALTLPEALPELAQPLTSVPAAEPGTAPSVAAPVAYVIDGADDLSIAAAARLMERGVEVRVAEKPFRLDGREFSRGSVVIHRLDNRGFQGDLAGAVAKAVDETGLCAVAVSTGLGPDDLPDLGGEHFQRLEPPRIALMSRGYSAGDYGSIWHALDHQVAVRHAHLEDAGGADLSRYNVLIVPGGRPGLSTALAGTVKEWVRNGGTLVAVAGSVAGFINEKAEFSKVRPLPEVLGRLAEYELAIWREWFGRAATIPAEEAVWAHRATPGSVAYPWQAIDGPHADEKELKKRDAWQSLFMPQGAVLATRVDTNHWLTAGCAEVLPVLTGHQQILMAAEGVEAPIRYGYLTAISKEPHATAASAIVPSAESAVPKPEMQKQDADKNGPPGGDGKGGDKKSPKEAPRIGWCALPEGTEMHLRMSGLLWPEAAHRVANSAWVTREPFGRGQVILFATSPTFRGCARGTTRVFLNAVVYGPGFGAAQPVRP